jgi:hypothetical protein
MRKIKLFVLAGSVMLMSCNKVYRVDTYSNDNVVTNLVVATSYSGAVAKVVERSKNTKYPVTKVISCSLAE